MSSPPVFVFFISIFFKNTEIDTGVKTEVEMFVRQYLKFKNCLLALTDIFAVQILECVQHIRIN